VLFLSQTKIKDMKIIEVINCDTDMCEIELSIGDDWMSKKDREANVTVYFDWEWNDDRRVVSEIKPVRMEDIHFYENPGNYFAVLNWAKELVTIGYIENVIN
jgi:hypothetical protein